MLKKNCYIKLSLLLNYLYILYNINLYAFIYSIFLLMWTLHCSTVFIEKIILEELNGKKMIRTF